MQWIFAIVLCLWASGIADTRQIRINRYAASVQEDEVQQAVVKELKPYPAAGYRPQGRAFWLPGEVGSGTATDQLTTTTELPLDDAITSTTESLDLSTTTTMDNLEATTTTITTTKTTAAPSQVDFRSGRNYSKAPYPAAGYRPSRAFLLPTELNLDQQQQQQQKQQIDAATATPSPEAKDNADHPVCGVSTNPLMPTPEPGAKSEPDAESVVITGNLGPAVLVAKAPAANVIPVAIPLRSQPLIQAPRRGFVYTTHVEQRW